MLTIIGDVHGKHAEYLRIVEGKTASVQVGDFGFDYRILDNVDSANHKLIGGNHDNYSTIGNYPHYLGDFGTATVGDVSFFFVRGELSVDKHLRTTGVNWWPQEEMDWGKMYNAIDAYAEAKPSVVISHGCPADVLPFFVTNALKIFPSRTAQMLDSMWSIHRPKRWFFGHHHNTETLVVGDCVFQCLNELEAVDISI